MFTKKHSKPQNRIDSLIGAGTVIEGDMTFVGGLRHRRSGKWQCYRYPGKPSTLVLSELARVNGEVNVTHLVVNGIISGPVSASEYLELQSKAKVTGDVHYKSLESSWAQLWKVV